MVRRVGDHQKYNPPRFHQLIHALSPNTLINDRLGDDYDFITPEQFIPHKGVPVRTGKPPAGNQGGEGLFKALPAMLRIPIKSDRYYLHVFDWPAAGRIEIEAFPAPVANVSLLSGEPLAFRQDSGCLEIQLPAQAPDPTVSVISVQTSNFQPMREKQ